MKKRILSMLLAICLIVGLLPMTTIHVHAARSTRTVYIFGTAYKAIDGTPAYGTIDPETGKPSEPTTTEPADWNIKFGYENADDTAPTLTLRNATLGKAYKHPDKDSKYGLDQYGFVYDAASPTDMTNSSMISYTDSSVLNIVAEGENYIYSHGQGILVRSRGANMTTDADSSLTIISNRSCVRNDDGGGTASAYTITLNGNFNFQTVHAMKYTLDEDGNPVFDGTNVKNVSGNPIYAQYNDVVIAGGNINMYANGDYISSAIYIYHANKTTNGNFKMTGGNLFINARAVVYTPQGTAVMEGGKLVLKSNMSDAGHRKQATAVVAGDGKFVIKGGEVLMYESMARYGGLFSYFSKWDSTQTNGMATVMGTGTYVTRIDLSEYNGAYTAIGSTDNSSTGNAPANSTTKTWTAEDENLNLHLCYFHVAPSAHEHNYETKYDDTYHWTECECEDATEKVEHIFTDDHDTDCDCGYTRDAIHTYNINKYDDTYHWTECSCGEATEKVMHIFNDDHDTDCDCGYTRDAIHTYNINKYDDTYHWAECSCGEIANKAEHVFTDDHDTACDCGYTRDAIHTYNIDKYDDTYHWDECSCGEITNKAEHVFTDDHDITCDCGYTREAIHTYNIDKYDDTYHWTECSCGEATEKVKHDLSDWSNGEKTCSGCDYKVTCTHTWDNAHDTECNECGTSRDAIHTIGNEWSYDETNHWKYCIGCKDEKFDEAPHVYENYTSNNDAAIGKNETETGTCVCGATDTRDIPDTALTAVAKVGDTEYADLQEAVNAANNNTVVLLDDLDLGTGWILVDGITVTLDLDGNKLTGSGWDGVIHAINGAKVTITGNGAIVAKEAISATQLSAGEKDYAMVVFAEGANTVVTIKNGTFSNENTNDETQEDMIYVKYGGTVNIEDGTFNCATPKWTLNTNNGEPGAINVTGGTFYKYDPTGGDDAIDVEFLAAGLHTKAEGDYFTVCTGTVGTAWEKDGNTHWNTCSGCDAKFNEATHVYENYTSNNDAAIGKNETETGTCVCGAVHTRDIPNTALTAVAKVGDTEYADLQEAVNAANGGTVVLLDSLDLKNGWILVDGITVTLDLAGKTLTGNGWDGVIKAENGANVTITGNGAIVAKEGVSATELGASVGNDYAMVVFAEGANTVVTIKNGTFSNENTNDETQQDMIYVKAGAVINIEGGTYNCATPKWTLNVSGKAPGTIVVSGGMFNGYNPAASDTENPIANFLADGYHAKVEGNYFTTCNGEEEVIPAVEGSCTESSWTAGSKCSVCDEILVAPVETPAPGHSEEEIPAVEGSCTESSWTAGSKCSVCDEILVAPVETPAPGHDYDDGVVTVEPGLNNEGEKTFTCQTCGHSYTQVIAPTNGNAVAKIGSVYYESLADAYEAAVNGDTIVLLKTVTVGEGLVIKKSITIDFNGKTYYFSTPVGSNSTVSNGFQILEEAGEVTLKNGTLRAREDKADLFYILIQNYADLTITDMTLVGYALDKWALTDGDSYVLSNNSGNVTINGNTTILANDDGDLAYALDSCKFKTYDAPVVTIEGNVAIHGNMELTGGTINFNGGTYKGTLVCSSGNATKADTVSVKTAEGYCWSAEGVLGAHNPVGATCTELGTCAHCGEVGGELAAHNEVVDAAVEATCTTSGLTEGKHCADCGAITVVQHTVLRTGHNYELKETVKPTNTTGGYDLYVCSHCGDRSERNRVAALTKAVVTFNGDYYNSLADALAAAEASDAEEKVITFLRNIRGGVLEIDFDLTIDFDGHYYTAEANATGAALVNNAKLTLKGGILEVNFNDRKTFDTLIVNNGTLNVENMTLKGSHLQKTEVTVPSYIVKNAAGATVTTTGTITVLTRNRYAVIGFDL